MDVELLLKTVYEIELDSKPRDASKLLLRYIESHLMYSNFAAIDNLLESADINSLSKWSICALLRFTACAKQYLPHWDNAYVTAFGVLSMRCGEDAEKLLVGLSIDSAMNTTDMDSNDLNRFTTHEERKLLKLLETKLPYLMCWELQAMFNRFINELDKQEKRVESITDDITDYVINANKLFNKWDQFK